MPKIVDHDQRRSDILNHCFELFSRKGYGSVRMREIALAASISIGTLYHYFENREQIGKALFPHLVTKIASDATDMWQADSSQEQQEPLLVTFLNENRKRLGQLLALGIDHHRLYPDSREVTEQAMENIRHVMINLMELDESSGDRLYALILGWLVRDILEPHSTSFDAGFIEGFR